MYVNCTLNEYMDGWMYFTSLLYKPSAILCFCSYSRVYYTATVSAHSSLVGQLVFIDTYVVFILLVLEQINKCINVNVR